MTPRTMRIAAALAAAALGVSACGAPLSDDQPGSAESLHGTEDAFRAERLVGRSETTRHETQAGGMERSYLVSAPPQAARGRALPLIFVFHGKDGNGEWMRGHSRMDQAEAIVVYLDGHDRAWAPAPYATTTGEQDLDFVDKVRAEVDAEYNVDPARVFATGLSNGGGFAAYLGCQRPQEFTAVAAVSAAYYWSVSEHCSQIPIKHLDIHGTADNVIEYHGGVRHDTEYASVPAILEENARRNHCSDDVATSPVGDKGTRYTWLGCDAPLEHIRIENGGHTWPGGPGDETDGVPTDVATREILGFFGVDHRIVEGSNDPK